MRVTKGHKLNEKQLYHVQSISDYSDDPLDYFIWADHMPTREEVREVVKEDIDPSNTEWIAEIMSGYNVYSVYAEEI